MVFGLLGAFGGPPLLRHVAQTQLSKLLEAWESDKIEPIWKEGKVWTGVRFKDHTVKFKTGLLPGRKEGSLTLK